VKRFLIVLALVVAGCGTSEEDRVHDAVDRYRLAIVANDAARMCAQMTERTRASLAFEEHTCPEMLGSSMDQLTVRERQHAGRAQKVTIRIHGTTATADLGSKPGTRLHLRKEDGEWRIEAS
jgi:hypothetical protein